MHTLKIKLNKLGTETKMLVNSMLLLAVVMSVSYIYFIQSSVIHIVQREKIDEEIASLGVSVASLESQYILMRNSLSLGDAEELGFEQSFNKVNFANVSGGSVTGGLSFLGNEI